MSRTRYHRSGSPPWLSGKSNTFKSIVLLDVQHVVASQEQFLKLIHLLTPHYLRDCSQQQVHCSVQVAQGALEEGVIIVELDFHGTSEQLLDEVGGALMAHLICTYIKLQSMSWFTNLLVTVLLFFNAVAILNEKRFLKKYGFHTEAAQANGQNETLTSKSQIIMMIFALRSFGKYFLIVLNILAIVLEIF